MQQRRDFYPQMALDSATQLGLSTDSTRTGDTMTDRTGWDERNKPNNDKADPAGIMTPALREALDALEREFEKMMKDRKG